MVSDVDMTTPQATSRVGLLASELCDRTLLLDELVTRQTRWIGWDEMQNDLDSPGQIRSISARDPIVFLVVVRETGRTDVRNHTVAAVQMVQWHRV